jgi:hypothetical protein
VEIKTIAPVMIKSLGLYFDNLKKQSASIKAAKKTSSSSSSSSRKSSHDDDDMPYHMV